MSEFQHVLLTRFNVREVPNNTQLVSDPNWLEERYRLFEEFCFPSVSSQSCKSFRWLVFFDTSTPQVFRQRNSVYEKKLPPFEAVYIEEFSQKCVADILHSNGCCSSPYLITSRLDNDDAISIDFIERVQQEFRRQEREVINFRNGIIWHNGRTYLYKDSSNAFTSMIEQTDGFQTVLARWHTRLAEIAPIRQIDHAAAWLQVVHGNNRKNRVRGRRVPSETCIRDSFELGEKAKASGESKIDILTDQYLCDYARAFRESLIKLVRWFRHG